MKTSNKFLIVSSYFATLAIGALVAGLLDTTVIFVVGMIAFIGVFLLAIGATVVEDKE